MNGFNLFQCKIIEYWTITIHLPNHIYWFELALFGVSIIATILINTSSGGILLLAGLLLMTVVLLGHVSGFFHDFDDYDPYIG